MNNEKSNSVTDNASATKVYSVYDRKSGLFSPSLVTERVQARAIRGFQKEVMNPNSNLHIFAPEFDLYRIGIYNEETGLLQPEKPVLVANAQQLLNYSYEGDANVQRKGTEQA